MSKKQTSIYNYNQIYDTLRNLKYNDYMLDKRNKIHNSLYQNAINLLIEDVNKEFTISVPPTPIPTEKPKDRPYRPIKPTPEPKYGEATTIVGRQIVEELKRYCKYTQHYDYINKKQIAEENDNTVDISTIKCTNCKFAHLGCSVVSDNINNETFKPELYNFNIENFQFIEYKDKYWYNPSRVLIVFSHNLIKNQNGNSIRLTLGPYSLQEFWDTEYIDKNNIDEIVGTESPKYVIEEVDYIKGKCKLFDKVNMRFLYVDLNSIKNLSDFQFDGILDNYDELFHIKRKTHII